MPLVRLTRHIAVELHESQFVRSPRIAFTSALLIHISLLVRAPRQRFASPTRCLNRGRVYYTNWSQITHAMPALCKSQGPRMRGRAREAFSAPSRLSPIEWRQFFPYEDLFLTPPKCHG